MGFKRCSVRGCFSEYPGCSKAFFTCNAKYRDSATWKTFTDREDPLENCFICEDHFLPNDFINPNCKSQGLRRFVVPSRKSLVDERISVGKWSSTVFPTTWNGIKPPAAENGIDTPDAANGKEFLATMDDVEFQIAEKSTARNDVNYQKYPQPFINNIVGEMVIDSTMRVDSNVVVLPSVSVTSNRENLINNDHDYVYDPIRYLEMADKMLKLEMENKQLKNELRTKSKGLSKKQQVINNK